MLYLSRLILDTRDRHVRRDLADCHQLHRTVLAAFPQAPAGVAARDYYGVLYRAEPIDGAPVCMRLLVQSNTMPDWAHLPQGYLGSAPDQRGNPAVRVVSDSYAQIVNGTRLVFRLRANPTKRLSDRTPGRENALLGKRVALLREDEQDAWLTRKGQAHGFAPLAVAAQPALSNIHMSAQGIERGRRAQGQVLQFGAVLFSGQIEVTDQAAFADALANGIGSGKAFGFGLLSVAAAAS